MNRLIINGIDFDQKLEEARVRLHAEIDRRIGVEEYFRFYHELGIIMHKVAGIPSQGRVKR